MKFLISLLFIFTISCVQQEQPASGGSSNPITTNGNGINNGIAYNNVDDGGNGGTGIDAITKLYQSIGQRVLPKYMSHVDLVNNQFDTYQIRIRFAQPTSSRIINGISMNGEMVEALYTSVSDEFRFTYEFRNAVALQNFSIHTTSPLEQGMVSQIEVMAGNDTANILYYSAMNLTSSRANFYNSSNVITFTIVQESCTGMTQTEYNGTCVQHFLYCSDYTSLDEGKMFCKIKRDDGQEVFCYQVENVQSCQNYSNQVCANMTTLIQYENQMFWGEINNNVVQTNQCHLP